MKEYVIMKHHRCKYLNVSEREVFKTDEGIWCYVDFKEDKLLEQIETCPECRKALI